MVIIGVDPGTIFTGVGVIKVYGNSIKRVYSGVIKLPTNKPISQRLEIIYREISYIIKKYKPNEFAIETAFYGKNVQSAMKIGYARGVSILAAIHNNLSVNEYSPREVKKSVVGLGSASKQQVSYMISNLLSLNKISLKTDESDALAIAVCHSLRLKKSKLTKSSWKDFIEAFPERVIG
ncbi:MAG: crossover junction endodeoxyribonuclease RuvC [Ignavibacterium sp.]|nr:crossover junction endodeoxyribonuclease RuvC [Ignavibacterium sp.]MCX7612004.1 crossover junction endodeoxyribonuclease RuvC [Ignavibacterium sp.]MDW8375364.1 crossover junction endodeoxyribonuclease RuvC [Ignavibacteriales bacterium]